MTGNDRLPDPTEDRLRRTFALRAEDMAPGDGGTWDASSFPAAHGNGRAATPLWRRPLLMAAAVGVVAGLVAGGLALLADRDDRPDVTETVEDPPTTTTVPPSTTTTTAGPIEQLVDPGSLGYFVSSSDPNKHVAGIWYPGWDQSNFEHDLLGNPTNAQQVRTNEDGSTSWFGTIAPDAGDLFQLWIVYPDGVVELQAANMSQDELLAISVVRNPDGDFTMAPPPGFVAE